MGIRFYNSITKRKEDFKPADENCIKIYSCGPTVYNLNHIGNFRAYVFTDLLRRYLKYRGYKVEHTVNITDVEDKIILHANDNHKKIQDFTATFISKYLEDLEYLGIEDVEHRPRATESIPEMIDMINRLLETGHAYKKEGSIYFRLKSFQNYGELSCLDKRSLKDAADGRFDVDEYDKEDARDFALWKKSTDEDKMAGASWQAPFGEGRPGWHLECSAMIRKIYGKNGIDIHTGGVDLLFPHHENEIAQSCCCWPREKFVRYWLHNEHLLVEGKKMSKSAGNFFTLRDLTDKDLLTGIIKENRAPQFLLDLVNKGTMQKAIRYLLLGTHYRQKLNFTFDGIKSAEALIDNISSCCLKYLDILEIDRSCINFSLNSVDFDSLPESELVNQARARFISALDDDLNVSKAMASIFDLLKKINSKIENANQDLVCDELLLVLQHIIQINQVLNILDLDFNCYQKKSVSDEMKHKIESLIQQRQNARANKDFKRSDEIRDELLACCIVIKDTPDGTIWEQIN